MIKKVEMRKLEIPMIIFVVFWFIAILLWQTKGNIFYLFNFGYLGTTIGFGIGLYVLLPEKKKPSGRRLTQLLVGLYILGSLGLYAGENMQLEGFFFYLLTGVFSGAVIHYVIAKIAGPILFGRGFCGWGCWTAMVLDFFPYKQNKKGRISAKWERLRVAHFGVSVSIVLIAWLGFKYRPDMMENSGLVWLAIGNAFYFVSGIILVFTFKDNRAFCKYLCPITVLLKITSRLSFLKIEGDRERCTQCGACFQACPMNIDVMGYVNSGERVFSTECILCLTCTTVCPQQILHSTFKFDIGGRELIRRKKRETK
jgi:polyferredoxin